MCRGASSGVPRLAIIVPCFNEEEALPATNAALTGLLDTLAGDRKIADTSFIFYVDDGSLDCTWSLIEAYSAASGSVGGIRLAANAGHQNALMAGLEAVVDRCDLTVTFDADLQDDADAIGRMVDEAAAGADVVYGVRASRSTDSWFKRNSARAFYRLMHTLGVNTVYNHSDFRLLSRRAVSSLLAFKERNLFLRGIVPRLGFRQSKVFYDRRPREAGASKYPLKKMINFAVDGITSFSVRPVRLVFFLGLLFLLVSLAIFIYVLVRYFNGETTEGWSSLILSIWFCTGILLMALGMIGEYVGKIYMEVKARPRYGVDTVINPSDTES